MADIWYFAWDDHKFGPFSTAQLKELAALGRLQPTDTVWKEGREQGVLAAKINHLFPAKALPSDANGAGAAGSTSQRRSLSSPIGAQI